MLEPDEYLKKVDEIIERIGSVPGNVQWKSLQMTMNSFCRDVYCLTTFSVFTARAVPCHVQMLATILGEHTNVFEASRVSAANLKAS